MSKSIVKSKSVTTKTFWLLIGIILLSLLLRDLPVLNFLFAPFNQFETLLHEMSHAIACVLTGGWVSGLTIVEDGNGHGGLTYTHGGIPFIYAQAGYMGEALWGCLLIALSRFPRVSRIILAGIGVGIGLVSIWFMPGGIFVPQPGVWLQTLGSLAWGMALAVALVWSGRKFSDKWAHLALTFLAVQSCLSSLQGIWLLLLQSLGAFPGTWSDATNMYRLTGIPAMFWGVSWALFSVGMLSWTLWMTYKAEHPASPASQTRIAPEPVVPKHIDAAAQIEQALIELHQSTEQGQSINIKRKQNHHQ